MSVRVPLDGTDSVVSAALQGRHVVLVGLMATGKSTVGRLLASGLGRPLLDNDRELERSTGHTAEALRALRGTRALHGLEAAVLLDSLGKAEPAIICAASSTIERATCRRAMRDSGAVVVWLRARPETLVARFDREAHRPRFGSDPLVFLRRQAPRRDPLFEALADITVDVDGLDPATVAKRVERALGAPARRET